MHCTKAVIAVAGYGTRRLPITKAIEKCMLPIGNRPIVDYVVEDCIAAGITDIIFVVSEQSEQIRTYYGQNALLEDYLARNNKHEALRDIQGLSHKATFHFVVQDYMQPYGTSIPVHLAKNLIGDNEPFLFLYGDNIFYNPDGSSEIAHFLEQAQAAGTESALLGVEVPHELVSNYGIIATRQQGTIELFDHIVEKPQPEEAPTNLNNAGCFLFTPALFPFVEQSIEHSPQPERYITDAFNWYTAAGHTAAVIRAKGEYLDCGAAEGWLYANQRILV